MKKISKLFLLLIIPILSFAQGNYYDGIDPNSPTFVNDLKNRIRSPYTHIFYSQFDETMITNFTAIDNGDGTKSVFCVYSNFEYIYSGTFTWAVLSREHTFPHSWMPTYPADSPERDEYSDQHQLFPVHQNGANAPRSNHPLGDVVNPTQTFLEGTLGTDISGNVVYEPRDEFKGDAARAVLYATIRHDGIDGYNWNFNSVNDHLVNDLGEAAQDVNLLLDWHTADPPDTYDIARNDYVQSIQQNRNPFVDHPEYSNYINFYTLGSPAAPAISSFTRTPTVPAANENTTISCEVIDADKSITSVVLWYSIWPGGFVNITMNNTGGDTYEGVIPQSNYTNGDLVRYYVYAADNEGLSADSEIYQFFAGTTPMFVLNQIDGNGVLVHEGVYARTQGDATVEFGIFSTSSLQVYFQDATAGLNIYAGGDPGTFNLGRVYSVTGELTQYNGLAELIPDNVASDVVDVSAGTTPNPIRMTIAQFLANPEVYEGRLIAIQHVSHSGGDPWPASGSDANNFQISDGTGTLILRIDKDTDIDDNTEPTWPKDVVGIFNQYDNSSPYNDGYQILPRYYSDFHPDGTVPVELISFTANVDGENVSLEWTTATEVNNSGFEIERARLRPAEPDYAEVNWEKIGFIKGNGTTSEPSQYFFVDDSKKRERNYSYRLKQIDNDGSFTYSNNIEVELNLVPNEYSLKQNYPNPFNPSTVIEYSIPIKGYVTLKIYDILGNEVTSLVQSEQEAGTYEVKYDAGQLTSGLYLYLIQSGNFRAAKKMILLK